MKRYYKKQTWEDVMNAEGPFFSIITVVKDNPNGFRNTIESLLKQSCKDYEYIVIDGDSREYNKAVYKAFENNIDILVSEKDKGIYDAMNKGARLSSGKYVYFLNAGDLLYDYRVLEKVKDCISSDIAYGNYMAGNKIYKSPKRIHELFFMTEKMINHQTIFAKRNLITENPFEMKYCVVGDRKWLRDCYRKHVSIKKMDIVVVFYDLTGTSSNSALYDIDSLQLLKDTYGTWVILFFNIKRFIRTFCMKINSKKVNK